MLTGGLNRRTACVPRKEQVMLGNAYTNCGELFPDTLVLDADLAATIEVVNQGAVGVRFDIHCFAITGTSVTFTVQHYSVAKADWITLLAGAAITGSGDQVIQIDPRLTSATNILGAVLPERIRLLPAGSSLTSVEYAISYTFAN